MRYIKYFTFFRSFLEFETCKTDIDEFFEKLREQTVSKWWFSFYYMKRFFLSSWKCYVKKIWQKIYLQDIKFWGHEILRISIKLAKINVQVNFKNIVDCENRKNLLSVKIKINHHKIKWRKILLAKTNILKGIL